VAGHAPSVLLASGVLRKKNRRCLAGNAARVMQHDLRQVSAPAAPAAAH